MTETPSFFTVAQNDRGAWTFVDPDGKPFVSLALNHLDDSDLRYPTTSRSSTASTARAENGPKESPVTSPS